MTLEDFEKKVCTKCNLTLKSVRICSACILSVKQVEVTQLLSICNDYFTLFTKLREGRMNFDKIIVKVTTAHREFLERYK